jgi:hypothetical protein
MQSVEREEKQVLWLDEDTQASNILSSILEEKHLATCFFFLFFFFLALEVKAKIDEGEKKKNRSDIFQISFPQSEKDFSIFKTYFT